VAIDPRLHRPGDIVLDGFSASADALLPRAPAGRCLGTGARSGRCRYESSALAEADRRCRAHSFNAGANLRRPLRCARSGRCRLTRLRCRPRQARQHTQFQRRVSPAPRGGTAPRAREEPRTLSARRLDRRSRSPSRAAAQDLQSTKPSSPSSSTARLPLTSRRTTILLGNDAGESAPHRSRRTTAAYRGGQNAVNSSRNPPLARPQETTNVWKIMTFFESTTPSSARIFCHLCRALLRPTLTEGRTAHGAPPYRGDASKVRAPPLWPDQRLIINVPPRHLNR